MKMDRSLFLLLTGTLAASGAACVLKVNEPDTPANPAGSAVAAGGSAAPGATAAPTGDPNARPVGRGLKNVRGIGGLDTPPTPPPAAVDGGAAPAPASACLDTGAATAGDCSTMADKTCSWAAKRCSAYAQYLQPKVAAQAVACTIAAKDACSAQAAVGCGSTAMAASCSDPNATTACAQLAASCGTTAAACAPLVSSLNAAGRQQALTYCSAEGGAACKSAGLAACINAALFPAAEGGVGGGGPRK